MEEHSALAKVEHSASRSSRHAPRLKRDLSRSVGGTHSNVDHSIVSGHVILTDWGTTTERRVAQIECCSSRQMRTLRIVNRHQKLTLVNLYKDFKAHWATTSRNQSIKKDEQQRKQSRELD